MKLAKAKGKSSKDGNPFAGKSIFFDRPMSMSKRLAGYDKRITFSVNLNLLIVVALLVSSVVNVWTITRPVGTSRVYVQQYHYPNRIDEVIPSRAPAESVPQQDWGVDYVPEGKMGRFTIARDGSLSDVSQSRSSASPAGSSSAVQAGASDAGVVSPVEVPATAASAAGAQPLTETPPGVLSSGEPSGSQSPRAASTASPSLEAR